MTIGVGLQGVPYKYKNYTSRDPGTPIRNDLDFSRAPQASTAWPVLPMTEFKKMSSPPHGDADADPPFLEVWDLCVLLFFHVLIAYIFEPRRMYLLSFSTTRYVSTLTQISAPAGVLSAFEEENGLRPCP